MRVIILGATGMVGQGVLRECLSDSRIDSVLSIGRSSLKIADPKLKQLIRKDLLSYDGVEDQLAGYDACFYCLGVPSSGKTEGQYLLVTYDLAVAAAQAFLRLNPKMTFIYVSGEGADSSETSKTMWARVKGKAENALLQMPFQAVYVFRPGVIQPLNGIQPRTTAYRFFYTLTKPFLPILRLVFPTYVSTTENIGRAMISVALHGHDKKILRSSDFNQISKKRNQEET